MFSSLIKNLSILKKFLFINLLIFIFIGTLTIIYLNYVQPNLIKKKTSLQIEVINNTINNLNRLNIEFEKNEVKKFLLSTRFLFQNLDRVIFFDESFKILADTDTLDLDPRSFSSRIEIVEFDLQNNQDKEKSTDELINSEKKSEFEETLQEYSISDDYGKPVTFTNETYNKFKLSTIKNVLIDDENVGYILISQNANDVKTAINERKTFVIRTAILIAVVIFIFSLVLNRYFLKPIKNLVNYINKIKNKDHKKINIDNLKIRNDELGLLSKSLDDMTLELQKRISHAENFSTDLVHEIRNPLASLKSASEILNDAKDLSERLKLVNILNHDVQRIERLITDYSQILKDEVALSKEKFKKIDLIPIIHSVVDDYNNIYQTKNGIKISCSDDGNKNYIINGIENRIEQIIANLLDNAISFSKNNESIKIKVAKNFNKQVVLNIIDDGPGFKEKDTTKIFKRFYSNRPDKFGQHSGLGLNIVKNLVELHNASITASNRTDKNGANIEIIFP